ncbi:MAG: hypothetical protein HRU38_20850 [Saccharospirillaceae bacterium]|nr:hypothetical protein [Pseudomonadales bacterium]NRB81081.1 hypothetical protein [Saccharospirillaceae bacterium]
MLEKLPQILTVLGLLMYPIARAIYPKILSETSDPVWILYTGAVLTAAFIMGAFSVQFKKMLEKRAIEQNKGNH